MKTYDDTYLKDAHEKSIRNEADLLKGYFAGCFHCLETYAVSEIKDWTAENGSEKTASCPNCGMDTVLSSNFPVEDDVFLKQMQKMWF